MKITALSSSTSEDNSTGTSNDSDLIQHVAADRARTLSRVVVQLASPDALDLMWFELSRLGRERKLANGARKSREERKKELHQSVPVLQLDRGGPDDVETTPAPISPAPNEFDPFDHIVQVGDLTGLEHQEKQKGEWTSGSAKNSTLAQPSASATATPTSMQQQRRKRNQHPGQLSSSSSGFAVQDQEDNARTDDNIADKIDGDYHHDGPISLLELPTTFCGGTVELRRYRRHQIDPASLKYNRPHDEDKNANSSRTPTGTRDENYGDENANKEAIFFYYTHDQEHEQRRRDRVDGVNVGEQLGPTFGHQQCQEHLLQQEQEVEVQNKSFGEQSVFADADQQVGEADTTTTVFQESNHTSEGVDLVGAAAQVSRTSSCHECLQTSAHAIFSEWRMMRTIQEAAARRTYCRDIVRTCPALKLLSLLPLLKTRLLDGDQDAAVACAPITSKTSGPQSVYSARELPSNDLATSGSRGLATKKSKRDLVALYRDKNEDKVVKRIVRRKSILKMTSGTDASAADGDREGSNAGWERSGSKKKRSWGEIFATSITVDDNEPLQSKAGSTKEDASIAAADVSSGNRILSAEHAGDGGVSSSFREGAAGVSSSSKDMPMPSRTSIELQVPQAQPPKNGKRSRLTDFGEGYLHAGSFPSSLCHQVHSLAELCASLSSSNDQTCCTEDVNYVKRTQAGSSEAHSRIELKRAIVADYHSQVLAHASAPMQFKCTAPLRETL
ncbi:unnamed protein product [Amoebophrya sp. A25]|nr:unnamed protein product [Amoebophrya sp. A25]|eukprot:GSA25T00000925001.1